MKKLLIMAALVLLPAFTQAQNAPVRRRNNTTQGNSSGSNSSSRRNNNRSNSNRSNSNNSNRSGNQNQQRHQQQQQQGSVQHNNNAGASQPVATTLCPDGHHPHLIDLGLPSGTKWACCNVGASKPEDYGDYFAWGETQTKSNYNWSTYSWGNGSNTLTKYNNNSSNGTVDNKTQLDLSDDAARARWGGSWRMPTIAELRELKDNCTFSWTTVNGVKGAKFTSRNGRSVFLPAAGHRWNSGLDNAGSYGYYWSSTLDEGSPYFAYYQNFGSGGAYRCIYARDYGYSVRPVLRN